MRRIHGIASISGQNVLRLAEQRYRRTLQIVLHHRRATLLASIVLTVATVYLFVVMPKGFMPTVDQGFAFGGDEAAQDTSFEEMVRMQKKVIECFAPEPVG